ncbi:MAG TPA: type II toxin-antitoxin system VapB family antitoxin [Micromonosporaceae bacterium]
MGRITVDVNDEWLRDAQAVLGTDTKVATINAALHAFALRRRAADLITVLDSVEMDFEGSEHAWRYRGGRDLSSLAEDARPTSADVA